MSASIIIGFDFGTKKMGVAIAQTITNTATPIPAIKMVNCQPKWNELDAIISDYKPNKAIIGLPDSKNQQTIKLIEKIKIFSSALEKKYTIPLPNINEPKKVILETYTKEHSAEYQSQALIDLARSLNQKIKNLSDISKIVIETSHHTHYVIGTGANDPQKMDPNASRETLDHSIMYIFAVALEDANWHHVNSYKKSRANKKDTIKIWRSIKTHEDKKWTKKYLSLIHISEPTRLLSISYAVFCLKKKKKTKTPP